MSGVEELPQGWSEARVSDVASVVMGQSPPSSTYNTIGEGLPFYQGKADFGDLYPSVRVWCTAPSRTAKKDDILLSVRAPVGSTNLAPSTCSIGRGLATVRPEEGVSLKFLLYAFRRFADELDAQGTGTTFKAVSSRVVRNFSLPIPPPAEQVRIADRVDGVFSELDAGIATLQRCQEKLVRYRASVLKAAVEGDLTADWREKHPDVEPASKLLQRTLAERRRRWEQEQQLSYAEKGKAPPKNWKAKYKEPVAPEADGASLPRDWCWATVDQCASAIEYGSSAKAHTDSNGHPVLRMGNITPDGQIVLDGLKYLPIGHPALTSLRLRNGDLLFNRTNSSDLVGKAAIYSGEPPLCTFASYLIRVRLSAGLRPRFLMYALNGPWGRRWIRRVASQTVGQANVNGTKLAAFTFPLPPLAEQDAMTVAVQAQLSTIDETAAHVGAKVKEAGALRQAILHRAFTGNLLPQDPSDEPAAKLLERIARERKAWQRQKPKRRVAQAARGQPLGRRELDGAVDVSRSLRRTTQRPHGSS